MKTEREIIKDFVANLYKYNEVYRLLDDLDNTELKYLYGKKLAYVDILTSNKSDKIVKRFNYLKRYFSNTIISEKVIDVDSATDLLESLLNAPEDANMENYIIYPTKYEQSEPECEELYVQPTAKGSTVQELINSVDNGELGLDDDLDNDSEYNIVKNKTRNKFNKYIKF